MDNYTKILFAALVATLLCVFIFGTGDSEDYSAKAYKNPTSNYCNSSTDTVTVVFDVDFNNLTTVEDSLRGRLVEAVTYHPNGGKDYPLVLGGEIFVNLNRLTTLTKGVHSEFIVHYRDGSSRTIDFEFDLIEQGDRCVYSERNSDRIIEDGAEIPLLL